ncbi:hypothetical protein EVAR_94046_1 [Eumeta japonica]|uniref:Uncharacterized protein n=1 Tax=Eumeta variegata TaxID=151549 RepID=A0A4C1V7P1_EUMVA|nr:hypothetical protein EVAR_94046_1 [Eumeta japonica]
MIFKRGPANTYPHYLIDKTTWVVATFSGATRSRSDFLERPLVRLRYGREAMIVDRRRNFLCGHVRMSGGGRVTENNAKDDEFVHQVCQLRVRTPGEEAMSGGHTDKIIHSERTASTSNRPKSRCGLRGRVRNTNRLALAMPRRRCSVAGTPALRIHERRENKFPYREIASSRLGDSNEVGHLSCLIPWRGQTKIKSTELTESALQGKEIYKQKSCNPIKYDQILELYYCWEDTRPAKDTRDTSPLRFHDIRGYINGLVMISDLEEPTMMPK